LPDVLRRVDAWLHRRRRRMRLALRPGLDTKGLSALRQDLGGTLPDELATLLAWHDGQNEDFEGNFADGWSLLRTDEITSLKDDLDGDPPPGWVKGWIPWSRNDNSFLVVDPKSAGTPVRAVWDGKSACPVVAPSLTAWFTQLLADFEAGRYVEDPERGDFLNTHRDGAIDKAIPTEEEDTTDAK
jgi:cell wall assembly regulator SMI1